MDVTINENPVNVCGQEIDTIGNFAVKSGDFDQMARDSKAVEKTRAHIS